MSDEDVRKLERALERSGRTLREWAADILGAKLNRWWILTLRPVALESEKCLVYAHGNSAPEQRFAWRTPLATLDDYAEMHARTFSDGEGMRYSLAMLWDGERECFIGGPDHDVHVVPGWDAREDQVARAQECRCPACESPDQPRHRMGQWRWMFHVPIGEVAPRGEPGRYVGRADEGLVFDPESPHVFGMAVLRMPGERSRASHGRRAPP